MNLQELRRELARVKAEMRALTGGAEKREDKRLTEAEGEKWSELRSLADKLVEDVERAEYMENLDRRGGVDEGGDQGGEDSGDQGGEDGGDQGSTGFRSLGEFLGAVRRAGGHNSVIDQRLVDSRANASGMSESPTEGGFLVQSDHVDGSFRRMYEGGLLASLCRRLPVGANANGITMNGIDETSRADGSRMGGVLGYWKAEADTATGTKPKFRKIHIDLEKLMAFVYATEELVADTTALESLVESMVGEELAFKLDDAILNGTGAGLPLGINNSDSVVTVAKESGQTAGTIVYENLVKMWSRMWGRSRRNSRWFINQDCEPELYTMAHVVGTGGVPVYLPASGVAGSPYSTLFGRPVVPVEGCQTVGTAGDIVLADLSQYMLIDKGGVKKASSVHVRFLYDEQVFRFTYRVNGQPLWSSALTPFKGSNTLSPFVRLATRS